MTPRQRKQLEKLRARDNAMKMFGITGPVFNCESGDKIHIPGKSGVWEKNCNIQFSTTTDTYVIQKLHWWFVSSDEYKQRCDLDEDKIHTYMPGMVTLTDDLLEIFYEIWSGQDIMTPDHLREVCSSCPIMPDVWKVNGDWVAFKLPASYNRSRPQTGESVTPLTKASNESAPSELVANTLGVTHVHDKSMFEQIEQEFGKLPTYKMSRSYRISDLIRVCLRDTLADWPKDKSHEWNDYLDTVKIQDHGLTTDRLYLSVDDFSMTDKLSTTCLYNDKDQFMFTDFNGIKYMPLTIRQMAYCYQLTQTRPDEIVLDRELFE